MSGIHNPSTDDENWKDISLKRADLEGIESELEAAPTIPASGLQHSSKALRRLLALVFLVCPVIVVVVPLVLLDNGNPPPNDRCGDAILLQVAGDTIDGTMENANPDSSVEFCGASADPGSDPVVQVQRHRYGS